MEVWFGRGKNEPQLIQTEPTNLEEKPAHLKSNVREKNKILDRFLHKITFVNNLLVEMKREKSGSLQTDIHLQNDFLFFLFVCCFFQNQTSCNVNAINQLRLNAHSFHLHRIFIIYKHICIVRIHADTFFPRNFWSVL